MEWTENSKIGQEYIRHHSYIDCLDYVWESAAEIATRGLDDTYKAYETPWVTMVAITGLYSMYIASYPVYRSASFD